ncbi:MAG TPA: sulfate ABC transporter substrate-binding protein [Verrucomicrobiae bacterium]|nr:sulfate ABC transporter substrate-binding protein [Verrucomicrobiae bacterium]
MKLRFLTFAAAAFAGLLSASGAETKLLNASFDIARELFNGINPAFAAHWKRQTGDTISINQSHAGSTKQARAVIDGLEADVVTFNQVTDVDAVAARGLVASDWRQRLPHNSSPFSSTIVFLVRKGNPKGIRDWDDLVKPGVSVIVPNPKTSGNGRYSYLAAYAFALKKFNGNDARAREFVAALFKNVPILDTGGRGATTSFVQREIGDVLLTFEAEVFLTIQEVGNSKFDAVIPSYSIEAEMPVAVVERVTQKRGTAKAAAAYLEFLYSEEAQAIVAKHYYRPRSEKALQASGQFKKLELFSAEKVLGDWAAIQKTHFSEGGVFDKIYQRKQ